MWIQLKRIHVRSFQLEWLFLAAILISFLVRCKGVFYTVFRPEVFAKAYTDFMQGNLGLGSYSDDRLYALAGWIYVKGASPDAINFEHPPLAKYIIGLSELAFMNHTLIGLVMSSLTLIVIYLISRKVVPRFQMALIPVLLLSLDKLYIKFSSYSLLDIYATFFAALSVGLLILAKRKWTMPLFYISTGLALSCKWTTVFLLALPPIHYALKGNSRALKYYPLLLLITILTYSATYASFFLAGHSLQDFADLQLNMLTFHEQRRALFSGPRPFWILLNFLTGIEGPAHIQTLLLDPEVRTVTVLDSAEGLSLLSEYNPLTWPLSFSASLISLYYLAKENRRGSPIHLAFPLLLASLSIGKPFIWYLLPGLPFAFISLAYVLNKIYDESRNKKIANYLLVMYLAMVTIWSFLIDLPPYVVTSASAN